MTEAQEYLTVQEVAKKLRVSIDTVYRKLADGKLKGVRRGRTGNWLIEPAAVEEFLTRPRGPAADCVAAEQKRFEATMAELRARGIVRG